MVGWHTTVLTTTVLARVMLNFFKKAGKALTKAEEKQKNLQNKYEQTPVGKLDKKLDDKYDAWLDKLFGLN